MNHNNPSAKLSSMYLLVPVFNELGNLDRLFEAFHIIADEYGQNHDVCFVISDDGSTDGTVERVRELATDLNVVILQSTQNHGPGYAFGAGFEYLAPRLAPADWVVTLEGDNTSRRELLRHMFRRVEDGYDVVLASPYMYGGGITNTSPMRVFISHMANAFVKEFLGVHGIMTVSSFFRLYRGSVILTLQSYYGQRIIERSGFECMIELLLKMMYLGTAISEIPMVLDTNLRVGKSKMKIVRTILGYIGLARRLNGWRQAAQSYGVAEPVSVGTVV